MPITSFTIAGDEVSPLLDSVEIRETTGEVSTMVAELTSIGSPAVDVAVHDPIVVEEDGVKIFAGTVTQTRLKGLAGAPNLYDADSGLPEVSIVITAEDNGRIADRVTVEITIADGTLLKAALTTVVTFLSVVGVTLHASQVNGPALPAMTFPRGTKASDVLRALQDATGYVSRIDYDKQLRMWAPGDLTAPFNISEFDDPARWTGDVEVENIIGDEYANRVIVTGPLITEYEHIESWTGDGSTTEFFLEWTPFAWRYVQVGADSYQTVTDILSQEGEGVAMWVYDATTGSIRRDLSKFPELGIPGIGEAVGFHIDGTFQPYAFAEDAADIALHGLYEIVIERDDLRDNDAAQEVADQVLADRLNAGEQIVRYPSRYIAPTLRAGQLQTIAATARGLSGNYIVTDFSVRLEAPIPDVSPPPDDLGLIRRVTAKKNNALLGKFQQTYRDWLADTRGADASQVSGTASAGPDAPDQSVQFNDQGVFGGEAEFLYAKATVSVKIGTDHTVDDSALVNLLFGASHTVN